MASAMRETPLVSEAVRNRQHRRRQNQCQSLAMTNHFDITEAEEFEDDDNASEERDDFSSSNNENTDDEFILIEKLPNKSSTFYGPGVYIVFLWKILNFRIFSVQLTTIHE